MKKCPKCGEIYHDYADTCIHCKVDLVTGTQGDVLKQREENVRLREEQKTQKEIRKKEHENSVNQAKYKFPTLETISSLCIFIGIVILCGLIIIGIQTGQIWFGIIFGAVLSVGFFIIGELIKLILTIAKTLGKIEENTRR